jgi:hypothetical protein
MNRMPGALLSIGSRTICHIGPRWIRPAATVTLNDAASGGGGFATAGAKAPTVGVGEEAAAQRLRLAKVVIEGPSTTQPASPPIATQPVKRADVTGMQPVASAMVTSATTRSVTLKETFDRPLVIGYQAYDVAVIAVKDATGGERLLIGSPVPTQQRLEQSSAPSTPSETGVFAEPERLVQVK